MKRKIVRLIESIVQKVISEEKNHFVGSAKKKILIPSLMLQIEETTYYKSSRGRNNYDP